MRSRNISILGSTGSVGVSTLSVVEDLGDVAVVALAGGKNIALLLTQIEKFSPELVACADEESSVELSKMLANSGRANPEIVFGEDGLIEIATHARADTVVSATVGAVGFVPTLAALKEGKRVALANKETLVMAGELMTQAARESGAEILPVDSEHNALHQCLRGEKRDEVKRLILTASGGPFRTFSVEQMQVATLKEALAHPTWRMGEKISIDSATLMNKGLEVIEAHWLFGFDADEIDVIVHPQSVIHSMIELVDGSVIAQMGITDMKHPIQYSLTFPDREESKMPKLSLSEIGTLTFEQPDLARFPNLQLAYDALRIGGTAPAALNAANEIGVQAFLDGKIQLTEIARLNGAVLSRHIPNPANNLNAILEADKNARNDCKTLIERASHPLSINP